MLGFSATYGETASVGNTAGTTGLCGEEGKTGNWTCTMVRQYCSANNAISSRC